jgi:hypothetical protein
MHVIKKGKNVNFKCSNIDSLTGAIIPIKLLGKISYIKWNNTPKAIVIKA